MTPVQAGDLAPSKELIFKICPAHARRILVESLTSCWCDPPAHAKKTQVGNQDQDRGNRRECFQWSFLKFSVDSDGKESRDGSQQGKKLGNGNYDN